MPTMIKKNEKLLLCQLNKITKLTFPLHSSILFVVMLRKFLLFCSSKSATIIMNVTNSLLREIPYAVKK